MINQHESTSTAESPMPLWMWVLFSTQKVESNLLEQAAFRFSLQQHHTEIERQRSSKDSKSTGTERKDLG
jgi:hypothetical protein